jgi:hypothetical protein
VFGRIEMLSFVVAESAIPPEKIPGSPAKAAQPGAVLFECNLIRRDVPFRVKKGYKKFAINTMNWYV